MAYLIHDISYYPVDGTSLYFCDANVWISALNYFSNGTSVGHEVPYQNFVEAIINLNEENDPQAIKRIKHQPKIVISSILFSEIINAYMRKIAMKTFFGGGDEFIRHNFKREYRDDPATDYTAQLQNLCSDFLAFRDYTVHFHDKYEEVNPFDILPELSKLNTDFNDLYYISALKDSSIPIVTNDQDFDFEDIQIITAHRKLLRKSSIRE